MTRINYGMFKHESKPTL